tara:strand:- start:1463 stop:1912 length:450 start_codon:yes stop_codon:yes gene_type:complete
MNKTKNIGWQKYEDVLEKQVNSPIIDQLYKSVIAATMNQEDLESEESSNLYGEIPQGSEEDYESAVFTLDKDFSQEILLATNYDCWIGHTDFNLTHSIKNTLNKIEGIEVLKIFSRYRFFIGVGRMFDFSDVRKAVETELNQSKGKEIE